MILVVVVVVYGVCLKGYIYLDFIGVEIPSFINHLFVQLESC